MFRPDLWDRNRKIWLLGTLLLSLTAGAIVLSPLEAQSPASKPAAAPKPRTSYANEEEMPRRAQEYYAIMWGVDSFSVKAVESGELIRFSYRIVDGERAKPLNDKKLDPYLVSPAAHVKLVVPSLEKVGQLRQSSTPVEGNSYWMAFSNPGRLVKKGDHVNIVIGQFHLDGLVVE